MADLVHRSIRSICAAVLPPECGGPPPDELATQLAGYTAQLPNEIRAAVNAGFVALAGVARIRGGAPLEQLDPARRADLLERFAQLRPETLGGIDGLKAMLLLTHGAHSAGDEMRERAHRNPPVRPEPTLDVTPSAEIGGTVRCDAVVVGSGAGGAMVARTLARAGLETVIVEEGRRWHVDEFRDGAPIDRFAQLYRAGGTTVALGRPPVVLPIGRAVGGTTLVNSGTCYRPPTDVQQRWRDEFGLGLADPEALLPYLDDVERTLEVGPVPLEIMGRNGRLLLQGAQHLGWRSGPIPRNAPGCDACCQCALGCPDNAKAGVHLNALPQACEAGARIISDATVDEVLHEAESAIGVRARRRDGSTFQLMADTIIVAAGATETPSLLGRSDLGSHPELGRNLALHPAAGLAGRFPEPVVAWHGVLQSAAVEELHRSHRVLIEATSTPPGMGSMVLPGYGPDLMARLDVADHIATFGAMIGDEPSGRVISRRKGGPVIRYDLTPDDGKRLIVALSAMGRLLFAAGAEEVYSAQPGAPSVRSVAELDDVLAATDVANLHLAGFHPTGTAAAGSDAQRCPVDETGRLRGTSGVWIADASVVPSCPEVNPQVSIMALAQAIADQIVAAR